MISIISGTNRNASKTLMVAKAVERELVKMGLACQLLDLNEVDFNLSNDTTYKADQLPEQLQDIQEKYFIPIDKIIIVSPEYNGSYPGILKYFLDLISVRKYADTFKGKKFSLIGVASGRAGNLRGMDQLTGTLMHVGGIVMPGSQPISSVGNMIDEDGKFKEGMYDLLSGFLEKLKSF